MRVQFSDSTSFSMFGFSSFPSLAKKVCKSFILSMLKVVCPIKSLDTNEEAVGPNCATYTTLVFFLFPPRCSTNPLKPLFFKIKSQLPIYS